MKLSKLDSEKNIKDNKKLVDDPDIEDLDAFWKSEYGDEDKTVDIKVKNILNPVKSSRQLKKESKLEFELKRHERSEDMKKSFALGNIVASVMIVIIVLIIAIIGVNIIKNNVKTSTKDETDYSSFANEYTFEAGEYKCGQDFKPGKYRIVSLPDEKLFVEVRIYSDDKMVKSENLGAHGNSYSIEYTLKSGMTLKCDKGLNLIYLSEK